MKIVYVDGYKIRQHLDTEFGIMEMQSTNPSQYKPKFYIPIRQIWVDHKFKDEVDFLMQIEKTFFKNDGMSYVEQRKAMQKYFAKSSKSISNYLIKSTKKDGVKIQHVDGSLVRRHMDPDFIFGGHDLVYDYIPKKTIWIDAIQDTREIKYTLHHEMIERKLMARGKTYDVAHEFAMAEEREMRRKDGARYPGDPGFTVNENGAEFLKQFILGYETKTKKHANLLAQTIF